MSYVFFFTNPLKSYRSRKGTGQPAFTKFFRTKKVFPTKFVCYFSDGDKCFKCCFYSVAANISLTVPCEKKKSSGNLFYETKLLLCYIEPMLHMKEWTTLTTSSTVCLANATGPVWIAISENTTTPQKFKLLFAIGSRLYSKTCLGQNSKSINFVVQSKKAIGLRYTLVAVGSVLWNSVNKWFSKIKWIQRPQPGCAWQWPCAGLLYSLAALLWLAADENLSSSLLIPAKGNKKRVNERQSAAT